MNPKTLTRTIARNGDTSTTAVEHPSPTERSEARLAAVQFERVGRSYPSQDGESQRDALVDLSLSVPVGEKLGVIGRSGSGKSTLLHLAAGIEVPTTGIVSVFGRPLKDLTDRQRTRLRRDEIGLVFQFFHLQTYLDVGENVALPDTIAGADRRRTRDRVRELLSRVDLLDRIKDPVEKLSGGEQQRVAICRALMRRPRLLLADEPTGNLDDETGRRVMDLLVGLADEEQSTLIFVTHSRELATTADRILELRSGHLVSS